MPQDAPRAMRHHTDVQAIADGVWQVVGPSLNMMGGVMIPSRSTVLRLQSGAHLVYSPIADMTLDNVEHVVAPNKLHHMFVAAARTRWPNARIHERTAPADDAIDSVRVDGVPKIDEIVLFHRPSKTLVVADFVFNMTAENLRTRLALALTGVGGNRVAQSREWKWACKDKPAARASVERILGWPIERVAFCHGEPVAIDSAGLAKLMRI